MGSVPISGPTYRARAGRCDRCAPPQGSAWR
jgi:hypothetical protein